MEKLVNDIVKIFISGNDNIIEFYKPFLEKNRIIAIDINKIDKSDEKSIRFGLVFCQDDIHSSQDFINEINKKYNNRIKIMPVIENISYSILDDFFLLGIERICFNHKPENVLSELVRFIEFYSEKRKENEKKPYIINFYESIGTFFVDISGELKKEKLIALKLMFKNYLANKMNKLKGIVYIFNNANEESLVFQNIWALFRIWKEIGKEYDNIFYLTTSLTIQRRLKKYVTPLGVKHFPNLLEIVKTLYPEISKKPEMEIFEFAASLLESPNKKSSG